MNTILTFDIGTTAIKTCLFSKELSLLAARADEYDLQGEGDVVELDSNIYFDTMRHALLQISKEHELESVCAIALTTQGETLIPVDAQGNSLHRAVVWLDGRAKKQADTIRDIVSVEQVYHLTGVTDINGFVPLAKLLWFKEERPQLYERAHKFLLLEDYLLFRLTGRFVTEKSLLTSTGYYDIRHDCYWEGVLRKLDLDERKLPEILDCGQFVGNLQQEVAAALGLKTSVKVYAGAMDQIAAAIGGGGLQEGVATATVGTALVITATADSLDACMNTKQIVYRGIHEDQYVMLPTCPTAGAVFKWFKDQFCQAEIQRCKENGADVYDLLCEAAEDVPPGACGVLLLPYFAGSMQPECIPEAKGVFFGLGIQTDRKTLVRAVLESVGYMLRENLEMLCEQGIHIDRLHFFGGGAKNQIWNQIIADIAGVELVIFEQTECGSLGAAILAASSMNWFPSVKEAQRGNAVRRVVKPNPEVKAVYDSAYNRYRDLFRAVAPIFTKERK